MPCRPRKARILLRDGRAKIFRYEPFTIQLLAATGETLQKDAIQRTALSEPAQTGRMASAES